MSLREMFSKSKKKRTLSSTGDPSESKHSFVNNVKSQVSKFVPARISQWFSFNTSNSTGNGSVPPADSTDSSEDEPDPMPPAKRKRLNTQESQYNQCFQLEPTPFHSDSSEIQNNHNILYTSIQTSPGRNTFIRETNYTSPRLIANADESGTEAASVQTTSKDVSYRSLHVSSSGQSVTTKRKSIFEKAEKTKESIEEKINKSFAQASTTLSDVKPRFRPSLYGSPFYPGPTMYGGASASTYINRPIINHQKVVKVRESPKEDSTSLSTTTKQILDLLENCSSPLIEAKRIPAIQNRKFNRDSSYPSTNKSSSYKLQELNVPGIASIIRVKQRSRLMDTTKVARQILASHSSTVPGISLTSDTLKSDSTKSIEKEDTLKLKTRLTRVNRGEDQFTMPEPVQLPTAVLHIDKDNLPKFSITLPTSSTNVVSSSFTKTQIISNSSTTASFFTNTASKTPSCNSDHSPMFKFSSPDVTAVTLSQDVLKQINKITSGTDNEKIQEDTPQSSSNTFSKKFEMPIVTSAFVQDGSKGWKCSDCWVNNKAEVEKCVACGGKRPPAGDQTRHMPSQRSTEAMDVDKKDWKCVNCRIKNNINLRNCQACEGLKLGEKEKGPGVTTMFPTSNKDPAEEWSCKNCWIKNKTNKEKCAACGDPKPGGKVTLSSSTPQGSQHEEDWKCDNCWIKNKSNVKKCAACGGPKSGGKESLASSSAPQASYPNEDWKCDNCWIKNKSSVKKCAACGGAKPVSKDHGKTELVLDSHSPFYKAPDEKFQEIIRAQKNKWECSVCATRNDLDKTKCQCCEVEREGLSKEITSKPFTFPKESNITFKFGIDPKEQENNIAKKAEGAKMGMTILEQTETNNNNTFVKIPTLLIPNDNKSNQKPSEKIDGGKTDSVVPEGPSASFTFGVPKSVQNKLPVPAVVPSVDKLAENPKSTQVTFTFGSGFLAPPKSEKTSPKTFTSFGNSPTTIPNVINSQQKTEPATVSLANTDAASTDKEANAAFCFPKLSSTKSKQVSFPEVSHGSVGSSATSLFTFGTSKPATPTVTTLSSSLFSTPSVAVTTVATTAALFSSPQTATTTAALSGPLFSSQQTPVSTTSLFSSPQTIVTTAMLFASPQAATTTTTPSASLFSSPQLATSVSEPSAGNMFGVTQPTTASVSAPSAATPLFNLRNDGPSATSTPFTFGIVNNNSNKPFGSTNNSDNKVPTFGSASNNDRASPFGAGFKSAGTSGAFTLGTAAPLSSGAGGTISSMSGFDEPGTAASNPVFGTGAQENAWNNKGESNFGAGGGVTTRNPAPFTFGAVVNQFSANGSGVSGGNTTLFGAQPASGTQNVFGMSNTTVNNAGLFGSVLQPTQPTNIFSAQSAPSLFGAQNQTSAFGASAPSQSSTFGAPAPNQPSAFGAPAQNQPSAFGASGPSQPSAFGAPAPSQPPAFGSPTPSQPSAFGASAQSQPPVFGAPTQSQPPAFGAPVSNQPTVFGAPAQPSAAPTPAFNFGSPVFNFGQQAQQQSQTPGVYNFGGGMSTGIGSGMTAQPMDGGIGGGAQFNVGSAPVQPAAARRMRKAVRRNPQR